jgi:hypothetical protein
MEALRAWLRDAAGIEPSSDLEKVGCGSGGRRAADAAAAAAVGRCRRLLPAADDRSTATPPPRARPAPQEFASGYLFGRLFASQGLQPDFDRFAASGPPEALLANHSRLAPTFKRLGVPFDARAAQAVLDASPGVAARLLHAARAGIEGRAKGMQHKGRSLRQYGMEQAPTAGLLQALAFSTAKEGYNAASARVFEAALRKRAANPNALREAAHLKPSHDGGPGLGHACPLAWNLLVALHGAGSDRCWQVTQQQL